MHGAVDFSTKFFGYKATLENGVILVYCKTALVQIQKLQQQLGTSCLGIALQFPNFITIKMAVDKTAFPGDFDIRGGSLEIFFGTLDSRPFAHFY